MKRARPFMGFALGLAFSLSALPALAVDTDRTFQGGWRNSDDIVDGWDWSLPPGTKPAPGSGIFNLNSRVPADFPGYHLKQVNAKWSELEPTEGKYDFSSITAALNDRNYDGIMLNVRGMVVSVVDSSGRSVYQSEVTAPTWLSNSAPKVTEAARNGVRITNMVIYDQRVKSKFIALIKAIGASGIPSNNRLVAQIIHGVSGSRGEECCASQNNSSAVYAAMNEIIAAWTTAYGPNSKKLAWLKEDPATLFDAAVIKGGTGARGGIIENWIRGQYTPGDSKQTGQIYDNGYLVVDENFAPIAQGRAWMDEYEAYDRKFTSAERLQQNYRMATLRALQMRRSTVWTETNSVINPKLLNWASLELGQNVNSAPDAWIALISTWTRWKGDLEVKNFERWLYQRDTSGAMTKSTLRQTHSFNASGNDQLDSSKWYVDLARTGSTIGIAVDDRFLRGAANDVAIKITYLDSGNGQWTLDYEKSDGGAGSKRVQVGNSGLVRTATFFISDFKAPANGTDADFWLRSTTGSTPFMFARVIRLGASANVAVPQPPSSLTVE